MTDGDDLERYFEAARRETAELPDALARRMLDDAASVQGRPRLHVVAPAAPTGVARRWWVQLGEMLGGWYGAGGLVAACAAGIWMGFAPPSGLPDPVGLLVESRSTVLDLYDGEGLVMALAEDF